MRPSWVTHLLVLAGRWGKVNQPMKPEVFDELFEKAVTHFNTLDKAYVFDGFCGTCPV